MSISSSGNSINGNGAGSIEKTRNTQMPAAVPSQKPPWILHSSSIKNTVKANLMIWIFCLALMLPLL